MVLSAYSMVMTGASVKLLSVDSVISVASMVVVATFGIVSDSEATAIDEAAFVDSETTCISKSEPIICKF